MRLTLSRILSKKLLPTQPLTKVLFIALPATLLISGAVIAVHVCGGQAPQKEAQHTPAPTVTHSSPSPPTPPPCTKGTYSPASASNTTPATQGLQQVIDAPQYYSVYGYTADQIRSQMSQCAPGTSSTDFNGYTNWWLRYAFALSAPDTNNLCTIQSAGVVVHITFSYPQWSNSMYASAGLSSEWQTFIKNLTTHENGHRDLATQYASQLYNGLLAYPPTDCSTISQSATSYGGSQISNLNQAEANYDIQTNHGATQGANL
ncbi:MAG: hypothetical protein JWM37_65 [Candidatus Saccharibacteria bacterium]|nr:hypothetical protein [Candidatus Saccharibacteria bacterium]